MADTDEDFDDGASDAWLDAEVSRPTKELPSQGMKFDAEGDGVDPSNPFGIGDLTLSELDELIFARSGELAATSPGVKSVLAANAALLLRHEEEEVDEPVALIGSMSDEEFDELVRRRPGIGGRL